MKEVMKCSISGVAFTLDADAYEALSAYIESLEKSYEGTQEGEEIIADIEARIAELILSRQDNNRIVERPLIDGIISQLGSAEAINDTSENEETKQNAPRIPRRLYRDMENAKLGGVCAGIARYFDVDPVWVRLGIFTPLLLNVFGWVDWLYWIHQFAGNLFGIFILGYLIMWFAVPAARTARQKLEMTGQRITEKSIRETTAAASAQRDIDSTAKPVVADAVSAFGQVVLILLKILAGVIVFSLIMAACALIIGLFAVCIGGAELIGPQYSIWLPITAIFAVLIPIIMLIYVLMCLIASRKPDSKTMLAIFLVWLLAIFICSGVAIRDKFHPNTHEIKRIMKTEAMFSDDEPLDGETVSDETDGKKPDKEIKISVPEKNIDIKISPQKIHAHIGEAAPRQAADTAASVIK